MLHASVRDNSDTSVNVHSPLLNNRDAVANAFACSMSNAINLLCSHSCISHAGAFPCMSVFEFSYSHVCLWQPRLQEACPSIPSRKNVYARTSLGVCLPAPLCSILRVPECVHHHFHRKSLNMVAWARRLGWSQCATWTYNPSGLHSGHGLLARVTQPCQQLIIALISTCCESRVENQPIELVLRRLRLFATHRRRLTLFCQDPPTRYVLRAPRLVFVRQSARWFTGFIDLPLKYRRHLPSKNPNPDQGNMVRPNPTLEEQERCKHMQAHASTIVTISRTA